MKLNKKGNHVGVILSFVIFIMFVTFLYIFIAPSLESRESRASKINGLQNQILENVTQIMTVRGVKVNSTDPKFKDDKKQVKFNCFELVDFFLRFPIEDKKVAIQTIYTPELKPCNETTTPNSLLLSTGDANIKLVSPKAFVKIYNSSGIPPIILGPPPSQALCDPLDFGTEYYVGYTREEKLVMASAIQSLILHYQTDAGYDQLKRIFNVGGDFGFNFTYQNGTSIGTTKYVPQSVEVYSQEYPIVYAANNRGLEVGTLSVRIW